MLARFALVSAAVGLAAATTKDLSISADRLRTATTETPLLSGGMDGCRGADGKADWSLSTCSGGLAEARFALRQHETTPDPVTHPPPTFIPTAEYSGEFIMTHPKKWEVQCEIFKKFGIGAFRATRMSLTDAQAAVSSWTCDAKLLLTNAKHEPAKLWYKDVERIHVSETGLAVIAVAEDASPRSTDIVGAIVTAVESVKANPKVKAVIVLVRRADPKTIATHLLGNSTFVTAVVSTSKTVTAELVNDAIWIGGVKGATFYTMTRVIVAELTAPFTPYTAGGAASFVSAAGLKLRYHSTVAATPTERADDAAWKEDQTFMQSLVTAARAHDPVVGKASTDVPAAVTDGQNACYKGSCAQGTLLVNVMKGHTATPAMAVSHPLSGKGWKAGQDIKVSDVWAAFPYDDFMCTAKLRGATLLRVLNASVANGALSQQTAVTQNPSLLMQLADIRVTFGTSLAPSDRLTKVEVLKSGSWVDLDRAALYDMAFPDFDVTIRRPYREWIRYPQLTGEEAPVCTNKVVQDAVVDYIKDNLPLNVVPNENIKGAESTTPLAIKQTPWKCMHMTGAAHFYDTGLISCMPCPVGTKTTGVNCVAPGDEKKLSLTATRLAAATTHAPLLSGGMEGCRDAGVEALSAKTCTGGLAEAMLNFRTHVANETATTELPAPVMIPTAEHTGAFIAMHPNQWMAECNVFKHFAVNVFRSKRVDLTAAQSEWSGDWSCSATLLMSNAKLEPKELWYDDATRLFVDKDSGLGIAAVIKTSHQARAEDVIDGVVRAAEAAELNADVKALLVLVRGLKPVTIATALESRGVFATAVLSTSADYEAALVGKIWTGGIKASSYYNANFLVSLQLTAPFTPYAPHDLVSPTLVSAAGVKLHHYSSRVDSSLRVGNAAWEADQKFMQGLIGEARAHNPTIGESSAVMPSAEAEAGAKKRCRVGDCGQGMLLADALRHFSGGGDAIAIASSQTLFGKGWAKGPIKTSDVWAAMPYDDLICTVKLRGATLLWMLNHSVTDGDLPTSVEAAPSNGDALLQVSGLRVTYSKSLPVSDRLTKVEVQKSGTWVPLVRTGLYTVTATDYDLHLMKPYRYVTRYPKLDGEKAPVCTNEVGQDAVATYIEQKSPVALPTAASERNIGINGGKALTIIVTPIDCLKTPAPTYFSASLLSCLPCPSGATVPPGCAQWWNQHGAAEDGGSKANMAGIIVGVAAALFVVVAAVVLFFWWRSRRRQSGLSTSEHQTTGTEMAYTPLQEKVAPAADRVAASAGPTPRPLSPTFRGTAVADDADDL